MKTARRTAACTDPADAIDAEIALLESMRATASSEGELEMINDGIDAAKAARRAHFRTLRAR